MIPGQLSDHAFTWYAEVKNKTSGKPRTYYMCGAGVTRETVAAHIAQHFRNVEVLMIDRCTAQPTKILTEVPCDDYEFGIRTKLEAYMAEEQERKEREICRGIRPIRLRPISLKPLPAR